MARFFGRRGWILALALMALASLAVVLWVYVCFFYGQSGVKAFDGTFVMSAVDCRG